MFNTYVKIFDGIGYKVLEWELKALSLATANTLSRSTLSSFCSEFLSFLCALPCHKLELARA